MRRPDVHPDLIREALTANADGERPTSTEAAHMIAARIQRTVSPALIRDALRRHGWDDIPDGQTGRPKSMKYQVESALGPIEKRHRTSHHWLKMTAYERLVSGKSKGTKFAEAARAYVETRFAEVTVADYDPENGFYVRPGWPWEIRCYYRQPVPPNAREILDLVIAFRDEGDEYMARWVTDEHVDYWEAHRGDLPEG